MEDIEESILPFGYIPETREVVYAESPFLKFHGSNKHKANKFLSRNTRIQITYHKPLVADMITSAQVISVPKKVRTDFLAKLVKSKEVYRKLLLDIVPMEMALEPSVNEIIETVAIMCDVEPSQLEADHRKIKNLYTEAVNVKILQQLCEHLNLGEEATRVLMLTCILGKSEDLRKSFMDKLTAETNRLRRESNANPTIKRTSKLQDKSSNTNRSSRTNTRNTKEGKINNK